MSPCNWLIVRIDVLVGTDACALWIARMLVVNH